MIKMNILKPVSDLTLFCSIHTFAHTAEEMFTIRLRKFFVVSLSGILTVLVAGMIAKYMISLISNQGPILAEIITTSIGELPAKIRTIRLGLSNTMADYVTVSYVTAPNEEVARNLAKGLIENRLAACVNIVKTIESIYEWKGKIEHDQESMLIIKSDSTKTKYLTEFVEKNHPYDCPEVVTVKVESGSKKYLDWVHGSIRKQPIVSVTPEEDKNTSPRQ